MNGLLSIESGAISFYKRSKRLLAQALTASVMTLSLGILGAL